MIDVCCALIFKDGRLLAVQRGAGKNHPYMWEFPGGKVEDGETFGECIVREIQEELQLKIFPGEQLEQIVHQYPEKLIRLIPFICSVSETKINMIEHINYRWLTPDSIYEPDWQEADRKLIEKNKDRLLSCFWENDQNG